jgi:prevent-host-death family protein
MKTTVVGIHEAKTHFSKLVAKAAAGEEIVVSRSGKPIVKMVPYSEPSTARRPGLLAGKIKIKPGFEQLPPGFDEAFGGS